MKKLLVLNLLLVMVLSAATASVGMNNKEVVGEWKYEAPTAPYGYQKGVLILSEKEGKLAGEVKFEDGYKIELKNITYEQSTLKCGLYIDYEYISILAKIEGKKLTADVDTPEGKMKMTAEKIK